MVRGDGDAVAGGEGVAEAGDAGAEGPEPPQAAAKSRRSGPESDTAVRRRKRRRSVAGENVRRAMRRTYAGAAAVVNAPFASSHVTCPACNACTVSLNLNLTLTVWCPPVGADLDPRRMHVHGGAVAGDDRRSEARP
jgi:hypothetical protein